MNKFLTLFDVKLWKFLLVGVLNTIVGNGLQFLLFNLTGLKMCGDLGTWISSSISYFCGAVLSYFLNKYFTFKNTEKGFKPVLRFALNQVVCFAVAYGLAIPFISFICTSNQLSWQSIIGMFHDITTDVNAIADVANANAIKQFAGNVSMIIGSILFVGLNYIGQRFYAFKNKS